MTVDSKPIWIAVAMTAESARLTPRASPVETTAKSGQSAHNGIADAPSNVQMTLALGVRRATSSPGINIKAVDDIVVAPVRATLVMHHEFRTSQSDDGCQFVAV